MCYKKLIFFFLPHTDRSQTKQTVPYCINDEITKKLQFTCTTEELQNEITFLSHVF